MARYGVRRCVRSRGSAMSGPILLLVSMAGGLGATARFAVDGAISRAISARTAENTPWGTIVINLSGSLLLGLLLGLAASTDLPRGWQLTAGAGFLGGYTTFSAASVEVVALMRHRRWTTGAITSLGSIAGATAAAALGIWAVFTMGELRGA